MRVLVVEDNTRLARALDGCLGAAGYAVEIVRDGEEAWFRGDTEDYAAIILDLGLPRLDGLTVLRRWREAKRTMPVLCLTARGSWAERVEGIPMAAALRMGVPEGGAMLFLETLHLAGGRPFAHEVRWLNPGVLPGGVVPDFSVTSANEWLVQNVAYATGDIAFSAEAATKAEAAALGISVGDPVFVTDRVTWTAEAPITFVRLLHGPGYRLRTMV